MPLASKLFSYFVRYNYFIAFAALMFACQSYMTLGVDIQPHPVFALIFFSTLFSYSAHKLSFFIVNGGLQKNPRPGKPIPKGHIITFIIGISGIILSLSLADMMVEVLLLPLGLLTIGYTFPLFYNRNRFMRLREIPGIKIFLIAFVWGAATVYLPAMKLQKPLLSPDVIFMFIERMLFVFAITIPFDIRDTENDRAKNVKTIPVMIGDDRSRKIAYAALVFFCVLVIIHYRILIPANHHIAWPMILSTLPAAWLIKTATPARSKFFYLFLIDGTMVLQAVMVMMALTI